MRVRLYVEGGGQTASLNVKCREGFRTLLERAGFGDRMPAITACGSRNAAFDNFTRAIRSAQADDYPMLLVDSEVPVTQPPWQHLRSHDRWIRPPGVGDDQAQLMVQCMETWCAADRRALRAFFGQGLQETALPALIDLEGRAKDDLQNALIQATRSCGRDRAYRKGARSFELLGQLDPAQLAERLPHFARLCTVLQDKL